MLSLTPRTGRCLLPPLLFFAGLIITQAQPSVNLTTNAPLCAGAPLLTLFESGGTATNWHWTGPNGFNSSSQNPSISNPGPAAAGQYYVTVTDAAGLSATASIQVAIHQPGPMGCNNNVIVSLDAQGQATLSPQTALQGIYDYDFYTVEIFDNQGISRGNSVVCSDIGHYLSFKVSDTCSGNSCWGNLKVQDKQAPYIACTDISSNCAVVDYSPAYLLNNLGISAAYPDVQDNCGAFTLVNEDHFQYTYCAAPLNGISNSSAWVYRVWRATDASGNTSTCAQYIFLVRKHLFDVRFPADTIISCETPSTDAAFTGAPYISEFGQNFPLYPNNAYCEMDAGFADDTVDVCDGTRKIIRTWVITEDCPLSLLDTTLLIHRQLITVMDKKGPVFSCPPDLTVSIDPFTCCARPVLPAVVVGDNCSRINRMEALIQTFDIWTNDSTATYTLNGTLSGFPDNNLWNPDTLARPEQTPCLPQGQHTVTYRATDDCNNSNSCSFLLKVEDKVPPVVSCDSQTKVAIGADGLAEVFAETFDDGSYDHCCETHLYARRMDGPCHGGSDFEPSVWFCCEDIGDTVRVVFRVYDCGGNYNECMVRVYVEDKIKPLCSAPANVTVDCAYFDPTLESYGFATAKDNCCLDTILASANYNLFDTVCNRGTIIRTFQAIDCAGNSSQCSQRVVLDYKQYFFLKMPDDKIVNICEGSGNYGEPTVHFEDCELIGLSYKDEVFTIVPEGCYRIDRHWKIINWCTYNPNGGCIIIPNPDISQQRPFVLPGPIISPNGTLPPWSPTVTYVNPTDSAATNYSIFWNANANCYEYKQMILVFDTKDPVIENCPQGTLTVCDQSFNHPALWHSDEWWDAATSSHDLCEGPADLSITASDACTGSQVRFRYLLFLDMDNNGSMETVINSNTPPPPGMVYYNNAQNPNFSGGTLRPFDQRPVASNQIYNFSLQETVVGNKKIATVKWKTAAELPFLDQPGTLPELPYGRHKIKWLVEDGCSNESFCEYAFEIKDCKAPTVVCKNGLSTNLLPNGTAQLWATDFLQYANDNCSPSALIKLAIRKTGTGTGFPLDANGDPVTSISFDCSEIGNQSVELWALDLAGNADFCKTFIVVTDNFSACGAYAKVSGALLTESQQGVEEAGVVIEGSSSFAPSFDYSDESDLNGQFLFNAIPLHSDFTITPGKNDNHINGVTTYDLVEISKHILGVKPLGSPYRMIAADANRSNSITSLDVIELRKLILGVYTTLPANTSWRFIDKDFVFADPGNPFQMPFPESKTVHDLSADLLTKDFVAVKIGDINNSAIPNSFAAFGDRGNLPVETSAYFRIATPGNELLQEKDLIELKFETEEALSGFQFTLNLEGLEVLEVTPGDNMRREHFALFPDRNVLTVACDVSGKTGFSLKCKALQSGYLHQMLAISSDITRAEAYAVADPAIKKRPALRFLSPDRFEIYPVHPNPFVDHSGISFFMPLPGEVTLKITDGEGRIIYRDKKEFEAGFNQFDLTLGAITAQGLLFYKIESACGNGAGRMIRLR